MLSTPSRNVLHLLRPGPPVKANENAEAVRLSLSSAIVYISYTLFVDTLQGLCLVLLSSVTLALYLFRIDVIPAPTTTAALIPKDLSFWQELLWLEAHLSHYCGTFGVR